MKIYDGGLTLIAILAVLIGIGWMSSRMGMDDDNIVENFMEDIVESTTGVELDLTPEEETGGFVQGLDWEKIQQLGGNKKASQ